MGHHRVELELVTNAGCAERELNGAAGEWHIGIAADVHVFLIIQPQLRCCESSSEQLCRKTKQTSCILSSRRKYAHFSMLCITLFIHQTLI